MDPSLGSSSTTNHACMQQLQERVNLQIIQEAAMEF